MPNPWPLVGRAAELADVADAMDLGAGGVLFAGPAGVGKTRLANECLALAEDRQWSTAVVRANRAAASIPYGAFAPLLPAAFRSTEGEGDALRQAAHAVLGEAGEERLLILVDDAHELDDASAALVHLLASSPKVFLVVTVRTGADAPEPVPALWKDELLERIEVPALDADAAAELVSGALGGTVDGVSAHALWVASGGNALFLRELVLGACDAGTLRDVGGGLWRLTGTLSPSTRLGEVVGLRLGNLSDDEREVVELVAVGEPVSLDDLVDLVRTHAIDGLERRGLIEVQLESRRRQVRMAHPLYGDVVRAGLPARRRQEIFGQLADALEARGANRREDILRVAVWRLDTGGGGRPELLVAAARQAHAAHDIALAVRLAEAALAGGAGSDAAHTLGVGRDDLGEHERAEEVLRAGEESATDPTWRARLSISRADNLFRGLGRAEEAEEIVRAAMARTDDPVLRNALVALRATFLLFEGRLTDCITLVEPLLADHSDFAYAQGALAGAVALALGGRPTEAITVAARGEQARIALGDDAQLPTPGIYLVARAQAMLEAGQMREAAELALLGYDGAVEIGAPHGQAWFAAILGRIDLHRGKAASAARWSREGGVVWRELRHPAARWGFGALASAQALTGDLDAADATYAELDAEPPTPVRVFDPEIDRGRASIAAQRGERTRACQILVDAADRAEAGGAYGIAAGALHDLARLGETRLAAARLDAISPHVEGDYAAARLEHAHALDDDDADRLDAVSETFERIGTLLLASEAASSAGALHRHAAMRRKATASTQRAAALLAECEGARPFGVEPDVPGVSLTRREREVAELAANNLTSREIAEKLFVSTRTVENHLQRAYEKLGVRGRRELRQALLPGGDGG